VLAHVEKRLPVRLLTRLDIAHSWGALLLLDEADVFLEKRSIHDIHRNALVSIFLRLLEYFQGILFLTTNRVETFDEAFVSRIHLSLRYGELSMKAKKTVWKMFIERVKNVEGMEVEELKEQDFNDLAKRNINGRQIKNLTRAAQALAVHEDKPLSMSHIKRVLEVAETFEMDLKGESIPLSSQIPCMPRLTASRRRHRIHGRDERLHMSDAHRARERADSGHISSVWPRTCPPAGIQNWAIQRLNWGFSYILRSCFICHIFQGE
jgi:hypothetical protein